VQFNSGLKQTHTEAVTGHTNKETNTSLAHEGKHSELLDETSEKQGYEKQRFNGKPKASFKKANENNTASQSKSFSVDTTQSLSLLSDEESNRESALYVNTAEKRAAGK